MRWLVVFVAALVSVAGCSENEVDAVEIGNRWTEAYVNGDDAVLRNLLAEDAVFRYLNAPGEPVWGMPFHPASHFAAIEDYDGDGVATLGDSMQAEYAFDSLFLADVEWECLPVEANMADCVGTETTRFDTHAWPWSYRLTVEDGQIIVLHRMLELDQNAHMSFMRGLDGYRAWIAAEHPDSYDELFEQALPVMSRECLELHAEMVEQYFAAVGL